MLSERARVHGRHQTHSVAELAAQLGVILLQLSYSLEQSKNTQSHQQTEQSPQPDSMQYNK